MNCTYPHLSKKNYDNLNLFIRSYTKKSDIMIYKKNFNSSKVPKKKYDFDVPLFSCIFLSIVHNL